MTVPFSPSKSHDSCQQTIKQFHESNPLLIHSCSQSPTPSSVHEINDKIQEFHLNFKDSFHPMIVSVCFKLLNLVKYINSLKTLNSFTSPTL